VLSPPYRIGPWPGLTLSGAGVLLGCALLLAVTQWFAGDTTRSLPDVPLVALTALLPMAVSTRIVNAPGAASAVCGAYVLPRAVVSLADQSQPLPPLLLVAALAFDIALWLRAGDFRRRPRQRVNRQVTSPRAAAAGAVFGVTFALVEPPFAIFLGANPSPLSGPGALLAVALSGIGCALVAALSVRGTAS
jgi:hypothetical protein